jgi:hypothetical protein
MKWEELHDKVLYIIGMACLWLAIVVAGGMVYAVLSEVVFHGGIFK